MTMIIDQDLKHDPDAHQVQDLSLVPEHTANYIPNHDAATAAEEAALVRKLDWRLLPFVLLLYTLSILDRSNIGMPSSSAIAAASMHCKKPTHPTC